MLPKRLRIGEHLDSKLRGLQQHTRMTPNLLCRIGFCLSMEDPLPVDPALYDDGNVREFNMTTLLGDHTSLYSALLRERLLAEGLDPEQDAEAHLKAHIGRGVLQLSNHAKSTEAVLALIPGVQE